MIQVETTQGHRRANGLLKATIAAGFVALLTLLWFASVRLGRLIVRGDQPPSAEKTSSLATAASTNQVQISLMWDNSNNLDLHCIDPIGHRICINSPKSASGGELDVEMNSRPPYSIQPVENIYWPAFSAPNGTYIVEVVHAAKHASVEITRYTVVIKLNGQSKEFRDTIRLGQTNRVHAFVAGNRSP